MHLLSAGAVRGLAEAVRPAFEAASKARVEAVYGAVVAMRERLDAGAPCDVLVLTAAMIAALGKEGRIDAATAAPLGRVPTAIAVPAGDPVPAVSDGPALAAALRAASAIHFPDPARATAGIHFVQVLERLGVRAEVEARLRPFPNGAAAMSALAQVPGTGAIGCTQATEILYTPGVQLVAALPPEFALSTVYCAAAASGALDPALARRFVEALTGDASAALRRDGGFEPMQ